MMKKNTDFKEAYKGPFEDFGYYKVFTSEGSMAFDFIQPWNKDLDSISLSEESNEKAKKIIAEGRAEAEANRLKVQAGLTPQEQAEWNYKTTVGVAEALSKSEVKWVPDVMLSGNGGGNNAMDAVGLRMVMDIADKLNNSKK